MYSILLYIWVNYTISPTWILRPFGNDFPIKTMIPSEGEQWGRYNLPRSYDMIWWYLLINKCHKHITIWWFCSTTMVIISYNLGVFYPLPGRRFQVDLKVFWSHRFRRPPPSSMAGIAPNWIGNFPWSQAWLPEDIWVCLKIVYPILQGITPSCS